MFAIIIDEALLNVLELNYIELRTSLNTQVVIRGINLILGRSLDHTWVNWIFFGVNWGNIDQEGNKGHEATCYDLIILGNKGNIDCLPLI
jgi:hypothetical protein